MQLINNQYVRRKALSALIQLLACNRIVTGEACQERFLRPLWAVSRIAITRLKGSRKDQGGHDYRPALLGAQNGSEAPPTTE